MEDNFRGLWSITDAIILYAYFADEKTEALK